VKSSLTFLRKTLVEGGLKIL